MAVPSTTLINGILDPHNFSTAPLLKSEITPLGYLGRWLTLFCLHDRQNAREPSDIALLRYRTFIEYRSNPCCIDVLTIYEYKGK